MPGVFDHLRATLGDLFPAIGDVAVTHRWGGPLGVPRDWHASASFDPVTRIATAGGYVGDGLSTTNLAGRTLADLITDTDSDLTRLPWVNHRSPGWEPEPFRFLGANAGLAAMPPATVANVAVTALAASIVNTHVPVPAQAPLQLPKAEPTAGTAVATATPSMFVRAQCATMEKVLNSMFKLSQTKTIG